MRVVLAALAAFSLSACFYVPASNNPNYNNKRNSGYVNPTYQGGGNSGGYVNPTYQGGGNSGGNSGYVNPTYKGGGNSGYVNPTYQGGGSNATYQCRAECNGAVAEVACSNGASCNPWCDDYGKPHAECR
jgi:hypothetical protein